MNRGFWHLTERKTFSFPAILPLPWQQMLHTNLLAANWHWFPLSSLHHKKRLLQPVRATIWHHSAQLGTISHQWHISLQAARQSRPLQCTRRSGRLQGSAQQSAARSSKHHLVWPSALLILGPELIKPWNAPRVGSNDELQLWAGFPGSCASCCMDLGWQHQGRAAQQLLQFKVAVKS